MDFEAGLPILIASFAGVLLFSWLQLERRIIAHNLRIYAATKPASAVTAGLERTYSRVRKMVLWSSLAAPSVMAFSGQLDEHGVAEAFSGALQVIAPFTSACFSAAVTWLIIVSAVVVHTAHCRLLEQFRSTGQRKEFW
ncbi:MAG: hypothetical protein P4L83_11225 [Nevskia sp.]|nr:hypothetical protein [Nevskia sp.]